MSRTIDERVVSMQFDNAQFERNVRTSMGTLDKLKQSLNLTGAAKGLESVNAVARGFNMSPLANGIETVRAKFSALEVMGVTALSNITNSAVNAGKNLAKAFTIEPIKAGFQEYETQINAVQTILANTQSKGTTLDQVNAALDELNHYADMTIYNFTEMTRNIGTFTAAGVDLDTSVSAIKGIANLAAVSGSTSQQASTAMYQLSQALAAGTVKLMDWNSVVNAGMGGQVFQDALKETARVHGIAIDDMIAKEGSFRETLSSGWLSSEILTETLSKFTGDLTEEQIKAMGYTEEQAKEILKLGETANDAATKVKTFTQLMDTLKEAAQSGWTQTWEILVGDFEEAKVLWTSVSDTLSEMINKSAEARNNMLEGWSEGGGRTMAIEALKNAFEALMNVITPIKDAFRDVFPLMTSEQLLKITERIRDLSAKFKELTEKNAPKLKSTFKGIFSIVKIGVTVINAIVSGIAQLIGKIIGLSGGILGVTGSLGEWISGVAKSITETNLFGEAVDKIVGFLGKAIDKIKDFFGAIGEKIDSSGLDGFLNVLENIWEFITKIGKKIGSAFGEFFRSGDLKNAMQILNTGLITSILLGIKKFMGSGVLDGIKGFFDGLLSPLDNLKDKLRPVTGMLDELKGCLVAYQNDLKANTLIKLAVAIGILAAAIFVMSTIEPEKLGNALSGMAVLLIELVGALAAIEKFGGKYKNSAKAVTTMVGLSVSILILASALKKIAELQWDELARGLAGILGLMVILVAAAKVMSTNSKRIKKGATQMVIMSLALKILASVCKDLSALSWGELAKGVAGISGILLAFAGFQELMKLIKPKKMLSSAASLVVIGAAMEIFAHVCKKFKDIDWSTLGKAGAAMGGALLLASGFALLSGLSKKMKSSSVALVVIGAAMEIFADVCQKFGGMEWESLGKAGAAISGILVLAAGFMLLSGLSKKMTGSVVGLTIIAAAMEIFADVCKKFGDMEWESLGKAGAAIAGILLLCNGFALLTGLSSGIIKSAAALVIMAAALAIMTPVLKTLGGMSWGEIAKGLVTIGGAFAIIGAAGLLLKPLVLTILALSASVALLGVACLAFGAGVMLLAGGIAALAVALGAGAVAIAEGILTILESLDDAIVLICEAIIGSIGYIEGALLALVEAGVNVLVTCVPAIAEGVMQLVIGVLEALVQYTPQIVNYLFDFLIGLINATAERLPELIQASVNFLGKLFSGIIEALRGVDPEVLLKAVFAVGLLSTFMVALNAVAGLVPGAMLGVFGIGAVIAELALVLAAIGALAQIPGLDWLVTEGGNLLQKVGTAIGQFIGGIVGGIAEGATSTFPQIATNLSDFMTNIQPFIDGVRSVDQSVVDGATALAGAILAITGSNLLSSIASFLTGDDPLAGFSNQLVEFGKGMKAFANEVSGINAEEVQAAASAAAALSDLAANLPRSDGWAQTILGSKDLVDFGNKLVLFGTSMKLYSIAIAGVNMEAITASASAGQALSDLANSLPRSDGWGQTILGSKDLADFGRKLVTFGACLMAYSLSVAGINVEAIQASASAGKALSDLTNSLPKSDGWAQTILGSKDLESFGAKLASFGDSMASYNEKVAGIDGSALASSTRAFRSLVSLAKDIVDVDYSGLESLGKNLGKFADDIDDLNTEKLESTAKATRSIVNISKTLAGADFSGLKNVGTSISNMVKELGSVNTTSLGLISSSLANLAKSGINTFVQTINGASSRVASVGKNLAQSLTNGIKSGMSGLGSAANVIVQTMAVRIRARQSLFANAGKALMVGFAAGIRSGSSAAKGAFSTALSSAASNARGYYNTFYNAGSYVAQGFADGIKANRYKAEAQARIMAQNAATAAKKVLKINSPSKVFRAIAYSIPEGFAQGIDRMSWMSRDSAEAMADEAIRGTSNAISIIADFVSNDIDAEPTIRPVLDLSNISSGADAVNSMLDMNPSVGVLSNVRGISTMMNRRQNGSNDDVISAINDLGRKISESSGDTYSINGVTYDDGSNVSEAVRTLVRAARIERRT